MADNIFQRIKNVFKPEKRNIIYSPVNSLGLPYGFTSAPLSVQTAMQLSAVYRCCDVISDAIASQSFQVLNYTEKGGWEDDQFSPLSYLLNYEPSPSMCRFVMMKTWVTKALLEGDGWLIINRDYDMGDPRSFTLVNGTVRTFMREDGTLYHEISNYYSVNDKVRQFYVDGENMLHIMPYTYDGINGVSVLTHAANSMSLAQSSEASASGFFSSGANANLVIQTVGRLTKDKADEIKQSFRDAIGTSTSNTTGYSGGIAVIEGGLKVDPISVNPKDAQMLETRKYNVIDICRFFGVHPSKVFDDSNLTYSNIESFQIGFITDTVAPWDAKIESEFNRKLLRPSKRLKTRFNLSIEELLSANLDAQANYVSKMFQAGGYTVNEVRKKCKNPKFDHPNADKPMYQINMMPVDAPIQKTKPIDKKVKLEEVKPNGQEKPVPEEVE